MLVHFSVDDSGNHYHELLDHNCPDGREKNLYWTEVLESCESVIKLPEQHAYKAFENVSIANTYIALLKVCN